MDANLINGFVRAAIEVLKQELKVEEVQRGDLSLGETEFTSEELNCLIGIVGQLEGQCFYCCSKAVACKIVAVMADEAIEEYNDMVADGLAELANVITGRATIYLESSGFKLDLSPPTLLTGAGIKVGTMSIKTINVPLVTPLGTLMIKVGLREQKK